MTISRVLEHIKKAGSVAIIGHVSPDGDSLGATLGLYHLLQTSGIQAVPLITDKLPAKYTFLPGSDKFQTELGKADIRALIVLDCGDLKRTGLPEWAERFEVINIDHHISNSNQFGTSWVDPCYAAVGQQIFHLAKAAKWEITKNAATCLYTAIATDTGFFRHSNTTPQVLRDAAELMELGADMRLIVDNAVVRKSLGELCIIRQALGNLSQEFNGQVTIIALSQQDFANCSIEPDEAEGMVEYARAVPDNKIAVLLRELPNHSTKVSLRSQSGIDVSKIAVAFGGGGHKLAAGCTINSPLAEARSKLLAEIRGVLDFE